VSQDETQRLRDEAASWLARMMRPDSSGFRPEFEAWLALDERHRAAYERLSKRFAHSQILARSPVYGATSKVSPGFRWIWPIGCGLAAAAAMLLALSNVLSPFGWRPAPAAISSVSASAGGGGRQDFVSCTGEIRRLELPDGSRVALDTGAALEIAYDDRQRLLRLIRGRARFDVAHEARPFIVTAGKGAVVARGTLFDVEMSSAGKISVALLRGAVDVRVARAGDGVAVRHLHVNQQTEFDQTGFVTVSQTVPTQSLDWPTGLVDVEGMPLTDLLARANSYAALPIEVTGPDLGALKISGRFRVDQPDMFIQNLADLFDLTIDRSQPGKIILKKTLPEAKPS
jgi:transmembrane sensor